MSTKAPAQTTVRTPQIAAAAVLVAIIATLEVVTGLASGSLALLGDAVHMTTDLGTLALTTWALRRSGRPADARHTFGYLRSGIIVATVNGMALIAVAAGIAAAAIARLGHPVSVTAGPVLVVAAVALAFDCGIAWSLHRDNELTMRSATLHFAGDAVASASVMVAAVIILLTHWHAADPIVSLVIAVLIAMGGVSLLRETTFILQESTPRDIDFDAVRATITSVPGVEGVHDLHIWSLDRRHRALSAHISVTDQPLGAITTSLRQIEGMLCEKFAIEHATLQPECPTCEDDPDAFCVIDQRHERHVLAASAASSAHPH
jgi:cobalt-zinc-cadmium efflux system protein